MNNINLLGKEFKLFITARKIQAEVQNLAERINNDLKDEEVVFVGIMNGAFMFASDLLRRINFNARITFVKLSSYPGLTNNQSVRKLIGINEDLVHKTVVVIEDIVDTGNTIESIIGEIKSLNPDRILVTTLLLKPDQYKKNIDLDYIGFRIPRKFVVGYGLDFSGYGRNLKNLYILDEK